MGNTEAFRRTAIFHWFLVRPYMVLAVRSPAPVYFPYSPFNSPFAIKYIAKERRRRVNHLPGRSSVLKTDVSLSNLECNGARYTSPFSVLLTARHVVRPSYLVRTTLLWASKTVVSLAVQVSLGALLLCKQQKNPFSLKCAYGGGRPMTRAVGLHKAEPTCDSNLVYVCS
jgi:hypothetical protein